MTDNTSPEKPPGAKGFLIGLGIMIAVFVAIAATSGGNDDNAADSGSSSDAVNQRSCEIMREIANDSSSGIDTLVETRDRFKDLLSGYGVGLPADLGLPLRNLVADLTQGRYDSAADDISSLDTACTARGF